MNLLNFSQINEIEEAVKNIVVDNHTWRDVCAG